MQFGRYALTKEFCIHFDVYNKLQSNTDLWRRSLHYSRHNAFLSFFVLPELAFSQFAQFMYFILPSRLTHIHLRAQSDEMLRLIYLSSTFEGKSDQNCMHSTNKLFGAKDQNDSCNISVILSHCD